MYRSLNSHVAAVLVFMSKKKIGTHLQYDRFLKYGNHLFKCYPFLGLFATSYNIGGFVVLKSLIIEHG